MIGEYSVDELLQQRANIMQEIADNHEDISNSSARWGCDCGCGGSNLDLDYEGELDDKILKRMKSIEKILGGCNHA